MATATPPVLEVRSLTARFPTHGGWLTAVRGTSFAVRRGETLGIVGESGSGKSVSALAILGLLPRAAQVTSDGIWHDGRDLTRLSGRELRRVRGHRIAMIFQEPMTSLNPVFTIGAQIAEAVRLHLHLGTRAAREHAAEMLAKVGIPAPRQRIDEYPHQLSGGMRQRAMIAMALACHPEILIADEPTTALDVTIQAQIIDLIMQLQHELGMAVLMISHDMGLIAETADRVAVMYAGEVVEEADVDTLYSAPRHPYTEGLLRSIPRLRLDASAARPARLPAIPGTVPAPAELPPGCAFQPRCAKALADCAIRAPRLLAAHGHAVRCLLHEREATAGAEPARRTTH